MAAIDAKDRPDFKCAAYTRQMPALELVSDVLADTESVKAKTTKYLPKGPLESRAAYDSRLNIAALFPATKRTWSGFLGLLFKKPPVFGEDVPPEIAGSEGAEGWIENIDNAGTHANEFIKEFAGNALAHGHAVILVDMPRAVEREDGMAPTLEDEKRAGIRPFWVNLTKRQIINWQEEQRDGQTVLTLVMIEECLMVPDGRFGEKEKKQYREFRDDNGVITVQLWEKAETGKGSQEEFIPIGAAISISNQTEIPIAVAYGHKLGTLQSAPPLLGLAEENLRHYRLRTNHEKMTMLSFPVIVSKGQVRNLNVPEGNKQDLAFSPDEILEIDATPDTNAFLLEPAGTGIAPLAQEIKDSESRMARLGLSMLEPAQQSGKTTTEAAGDQIEEQSELDFFKASVQDAVELALMFTAKFVGLPTGGSFKLESALSKFKLSVEKIKVFSDMVERSQFDVEDLLTLLKQADELPDDFDIEAAVKKLTAAKEKAAEREVSLFNRGGLPVEDGA